MFNFSYLNCSGNKKGMSCVLLHFNLILPGLEEVQIIKKELNEEIYKILIEMPHKTPNCSSYLS